MCGSGQQTGIGEGQFRAGCLAAAAVTRGIGDFASLPVGLDILHIRFDIDPVAANDPIKATVAHVRLGLAVALDNGREMRAFVGPLHTGVDDLLNARRLGCLDHIAVLFDPHVRRGHA